MRVFLPVHLVILSCFFLFSCNHPMPTKPVEKIEKQETDYIFFLHNKFVEEFDLSEEHPEYGRAQYKEIIQAFEQKGFTVISEKRQKNTDALAYAEKVVKQIDSLLNKGIKPNHITVIGTSKGGYIAEYVSTYLKDPDVNFVLIGCIPINHLREHSDVNYTGNILSIYEESDPLGVSAEMRMRFYKMKVTRFREIELHTKLKHGFLYKPLDEWIIPCEKWARRNYDLK